MDNCLSFHNISNWNSLEIAKLIVSFLTPLIVAYIAYRFTKLTKKMENKNWTNQKIIEKRIEIYDLIVPELNDLLCFYCYIGNWKEISPNKVIELKRNLDKKFNIYSPLFSNELLKEYNNFTSLCFETFVGWGKDAKIKSLFGRREECFGDKWKKEWNNSFSNQDQIIDIEEIRNSYLKIMDVFKNNLDVFNVGDFPKSDIPNINFK